MEPITLVQAIDCDAAGSIRKIMNHQSNLNIRTISDQQIEIAKSYCINTGKLYLLDFFNTEPKHGGYNSDKFRKDIS